MGSGLGDIDVVHDDRGHNDMLAIVEDWMISRAGEAISFERNLG